MHAYIHIAGACIYVCMHVSMYVCIYINMYLYLYLYLWVCVCTRARACNLNMHPLHASVLPVLSPRALPARQPRPRGPRRMSARAPAQSCWTAEETACALRMCLLGRAALQAPTCGRRQRAAREADRAAKMRARQKIGEATANAAAEQAAHDEEAHPAAAAAPPRLLHLPHGFLPLRWPRLSPAAKRFAPCKRRTHASARPAAAEAKPARRPVAHHQKCRNGAGGRMCLGGATAPGGARAKTQGLCTPVERCRCRSGYAEHCLEPDAAGARCVMAGC